MGACIIEAIAKADQERTEIGKLFRVHRLIMPCW